MRTVPLIAIALVLLIVSVKVSAQSQPIPKTAVPGFYQGLDANAAATARGESLFYQRCSFCHLPRIRKHATLPSPAPSLAGVLKNADKGMEDAVRNYILKGSLRMPAWEHSFNQEQMNDLITYMKTL